MTKTLDEMTADVVRIFKKYELTGTNPWTYKTAAYDLSYQVGSLAKRIMQLNGERHKEGLEEAQVKELIGDELADILAEVLYIAEKLNIDMDTAWAGMTKSDEQKIATRTVAESST